MTQPPVTRRHLLILAAAGGAAPLAAHGHNSPIRGPRADQAALLTLCAQLDCPQRLGERCGTALPPAEQSAAALARALTADARFGASSRIAVGDMAEALRQRSRDDFRAGRLAMVDGWMLSLTETRLYALATLTRTKHAVARSPCNRAAKPNTASPTETSASPARMA